MGNFWKERKKEEREGTEGSIIDQEPTKPSLNKTSPTAMSSACPLSVEKLQSMKKFNQRSEKMKKEKKQSSKTKY